MMVYFRKRINLNLLNKINQEMVKKGQESRAKNLMPEQKSEEKKVSSPMRGKLILDATARLSIAERLVRPPILSIPQI
jgi:hypothetical protein